MKRWLVLLCVSTALVALACGASGPPPTPTPQPTATPTLPPGAVLHKLDIVDYEHQSITIKVGESIVWTNRSDTKLHNTVHTPLEHGTPVEWESELLAPGKSFRYTFNTPGSYRYLCRIHSQVLKEQQFVTVVE